MTSKAKATDVARCDFCGRESPIPEGWMPSPCPHCGRIFFPIASRSRHLAIAVGCAAVVLITVVTFLYAT